MMKRWVAVTVMLTRVMARAEPHMELEDGDNPCLHKPCEHGVCVQSEEAVQAVRSDKEQPLCG